MSAGSVQAQGERVELARAVPLADGNAAALSEWFVNGAAGLEHGFTVSAPPGRAEAGERLRLRLRLGGGLRAQASRNGQAVLMMTSDGREAVSYEHLAVRDAAGRRLEAGRSGWLKIFLQADIGLLEAVLNANPNAGTSAGAFGQGHNPHKLTLTPTVTLTIPIFQPNC